MVALTLLPSDSWHERNNSVQVLLATDSELVPIRSASMEQVCATPSFTFSHVTKSVQLGAPPLDYHASFVVPSTQGDWYRLVVLNCHADEFQMTYSDIAINPDGNYLSLAEQPYERLFSGFLWAWAALVGVWLLHLLLHRHFNISAQLLLTLLPLTKGALCVPSLLYWQTAARTGHYSSSLTWAMLLVETVERMAWVLVAYFMASGWRITLRAVHPLTLRIVMSFIAMLGLSYFVFSYFAGLLIFMLLLSYVLLLRILSTSGWQWAGSMSARCSTCSWRSSALPLSTSAAKMMRSSST